MILASARHESIRNRTMLAFAYDAGLRREELCSLQSDDIDPSRRMLRIRAETTKGRREFEQEQANYEAERNRKTEILQARENTLNRILKSAPPMFTNAQLRLFLRALCNLDPYTIIDDVAEHFAGEDNDHQRAPEEILAAALSQTPDEKLTSFALRLAFTGYVTIPRENEFDFLTEAEATFAPPQPAKEKKPKKAPTPIKAATKKIATKKKLAA